MTGNALRTRASEWWRLVRYARPYWWALALSVLFMALVGITYGVSALLVGPIFDRVLSTAPSVEPVVLYTFPVTGWQLHLDTFVPSRIHNIWTMVAFAILAIFILKGICDYAGNYLVNYVGVSAIRDLRQQVFDHVLQQGADFFESNATGRVMSSIMTDIEKIQVAISHMLADLLRRSFTVVALMAVLVEKDWRLALVSLTLLPFVLVPTARIGKRIRKTTRRVQDTAADMNEILQEAISGHVVVKAFGAEAYESSRFRQAAERMRRASLRYVSLQALTTPVIEFFAAITIVGLLTYARNQIKSSSLTAGEFTSFVFALLMLYEPVKRLTGIHNIFEQALGAAQKVFEYLDRKPSIVEDPQAPALAPFRQSIEFRQVRFRYPGAANGYAIDGVTLTVAAGEMVALVGSSGAGKTTLVNLLLRFHDVTEGAILIDGTDIRHVRCSSLRAQISVVGQETFLFNDTVLNNIRYGRKDASAEQVYEAARNALADEFIRQLPQGYDTLIGERGMKLSGGQRQRLAIARALLKNAPILILDEATSQLDSESELLVQRALANLLTGRTSIVIAHRLSTIRRAERIVVLDQGRISEIGTHRELVNQGGIYQRLHELQYLVDETLVDL